MPLESIMMNPFQAWPGMKLKSTQLDALLNLKVINDHTVVRNPWFFVIVVLIFSALLSYSWLIGIYRVFKIKFWNMYLGKTPQSRQFICHLRLQISTYGVKMFEFSQWKNFKNLYIIVCCSVTRLYIKSCIWLLGLLPNPWHKQLGREDLFRLTGADGSTHAQTWLKSLVPHCMTEKLFIS